MPSDIATAARRRRPSWLIEIDAGDTLRMGTQGTTLADKYFTGMVLEVGAIGESFDWGAFKYSPSAISITIANVPLLYGKRFSDLEPSLGLENAECRIHVHFPGLAWADIATAGMVAKGRFRKQAQTTVGSHTYSFDIEPYGASAWRTMAGETINTDTWPNHRTAGGGGSVAGNPYPVVFGTHSGGLKMDCIDTSAYKYIVSGVHPMESVDSVADKDGSDIPSGWTASNVFDGRGNVCTIVDFTTDQAANEPLTAGGDGIEDEGGGYTGTAGDLIEGPGPIFHFLADNYSTVGPSWADDESIGTAKSLLPSVRMAATCMSQVNAGEWADRILYQCCLARAMRIGGRCGIVSLDMSKHDSSAIDTDLKSVGALQLSKTPGDKIFNDLRVEYNYSPGPGNYQDHFIRDRTNNTACADSWQIYGAMEQVTLQLPDAPTAMTAGVLTNRYLSFFSQSYDLIGGLDLTYDQGWDLRRGDCAEITIPEAPSSDGNGWDSERCLLVEKFYLSNVIRTTWIKLND